MTPRLLAAGARIVGGCCGTTPDHIAAMRAALDALESAGPATDRRVTAGHPDADGPVRVSHGRPRTSVVERTGRRAGGR